MKSQKLLVIVIGCALSFGAAAQWQWIDNSGSKVFSDRGPPPEIPAKNILKQPSGVPKTIAVVAPAVIASAIQAPKILGIDKALEEKKKQTEAAEATSRRAELEKNAAARAESCKLAKQSQTNLDSGLRIARINDKGEREILDDTARAAELRRVRDVVTADCK